jgi:hypothetical protein
LYVDDAALERLAQPFEDMPAELRSLTQQEDPMVHQRHFARPRHLAAPDQAGVDISS